LPLIRVYIFVTRTLQGKDARFFVRVNSMPILKDFAPSNPSGCGGVIPHGNSKLWLPDSVKKKGKEEDKRLVTLRKIEEVRKKW